MYKTYDNKKLPIMEHVTADNSISYILMQANYFSTTGLGCSKLESSIRAILVFNSMESSIGNRANRALNNPREKKEAQEKQKRKKARSRRIKKITGLCSIKQILRTIQTAKLASEFCSQFGRNSHLSQTFKLSDFSSTKKRK